MKILTLAFFLFTSLTLGAQDSSVSGEIHYDKKSSPGTLFIFARYFKAKGGTPVAIQRIESPKFPLKFKLSSENAFAPGTPFQGPFKILVRLAPEGSAWESDVAMAMGDSGEENPIEVGTENLVIKLERETVGGRDASEEAKKLNKIKRPQNAQ